MGELATGSLTLASTATVTFDVNRATVFDEIVVNGTVALGNAALAINVNGSAEFASGQMLDLIHSAGTLSGTFAGVTNGGIYNYGGQAFEAIFTSTDFELVAVPETATRALLGLGGAGLLVLTRARRSTN